MFFIFPFLQTVVSHQPTTTTPLFGINQGQNASIIQHQCMHDHDQQMLYHLGILNKNKIKAKQLEFMKLSKAKKIKAIDPTTRRPLRVTFDFSYLTNGKDLKRCTLEGQKITWGGSIYTCTSSDLVVGAKLDVVTQTFDNVKNYLQRTFNVTKSPPFNLASIIHPEIGPEIGTFSYYPQNTSKRVSDSDIYLTVYARPFGQFSGVLASAGTLVYDRTVGNRPRQGMVHINFAKVPSAASDFSTVEADRSFFETVLHETVHALGFSSSSFDFWLDRTTGNPYAKFPLTKCQNSSYPEKKFTIVHTPKLHEMISKRFGTENFFPGCPAGAEMEDSGGGGTAGSHFDLLPYFSEMMCGITYGYSRISPLYLAFLYDTGWYEVNYDNSEPLFYGDYKATIGQKTPYKNFATAPPQYVFPDYYIYDPKSGTNTETCTADHLAAGVFSVKKYDCANTNEMPCNIINFVDPKKTGYQSNSFMHASFVPIATPYSNMRCQRSAGGVHGGGSTGKNSYCAKYSQLGHVGASCFRMECSDDNKLSIYVGNDKKQCKSKNESLQFQNSAVICPDPNLICGMMNYKKNEPTIDPVIPTTSSNKDVPITSSNKETTTSSDSDVDGGDVISHDKGDDIPDGGGSSNEKDNNAGKSKTGAIVGAVIAVIAVIAVVAVIVTMVVLKKISCPRNENGFREAKAVGNNGNNPFNLSV